jgi:hypothetical protein
VSSLELIVATQDATPGAAPHHVSNKVGYNQFATTLIINLDVPDPVRAIRWVFGGASRTGNPPGKLLKKVGMVCGLDRCGTGAPAAVLPPESGVESIFSYADVSGRLDGDYSLSVYAATDAEGWI